MLQNDMLSNVLFIDLSTKRSWIEERSDLFDHYIGGTGVGIHLLKDICPKNCSPLAAENPIIFVVGPLTGLFPLASKTVALFKSPHTGNLGESHCGGRSAIAIRTAGYGAVVITGKSEIPVYLVLSNHKVSFRDASTLWGMNSSYTVGRIIRENEHGSGFRTIMRIGGAGERLVSYASVMTETYRHFGRLGLGAVFGSKHLKAVVISGNSSLPIVEKNTFRCVYDGIYTSAVSSSVMKKYHDLGTAENVFPLNQLGGLPTQNLTKTSFEGALNISGEALASRYLGRRLACAHCPVGCIHIAALREPYGDEPYFYKTSMISYDYEPLYAIGSLLGIGSPESFLKLMDIIESKGIDVMSTGVCLAWATEVQEKGLITDHETNGLQFKWGDLETYKQAVRFIVEQPNDFYTFLAQGVTAASQKYGGQEFALSLGGNEMPGYHTGPAAHIGILIGSRHSHLDNAGYSLDQKQLGKPLLSPEELARNLVAEEQWRQILSSLVVCFFARGIYTPDVIQKALDCAGFSIDTDGLKKLGADILHEKYLFKIREGFSFDSLRVPKRILEISTPLGIVQESYIRSTISQVKDLLT